MPVIALIIAITMQPSTSKGQDTIVSKYPNAVLVQLSCEQNRIKALQKANMLNKLELFQEDVNKVISATVNDFTDHFNYCPVYFYIDTNVDKIMNKNFDGILLNAELNPIKNARITDSNYMIVYYGDPTWQTRWRHGWDTTKAKNWGGKPNGNGLIINDHKFRQIAYLYKLSTNIFNLNKAKNSGKYSFISNKFDIEYYPFAHEFNSKVIRLHNKRAKKRHKELMMGQKN